MAANGQQRWPSARLTPQRAILAVFCAACSIQCGGEAGAPEGSNGGTGATLGVGGTTSGSAGSAGTLGSAGSEIGSGGTGGALPIGGTGGSGGTIVVAGTSSGAASGSAGNGEVCATERATAELEPVHLAFAFDVSGSMGKGDYPWHDATLKWDPVVAATRAFFEDPASAGLSASLTAFPIDADDDERCDSGEYTDPDVPMTRLPSSDFGAALDEIREGDWRGGTPTLAAVQGVLSFLDDYAEDHAGRYVLVLVTDGHPQDCDDEDDRIEAVADVVSAVADEIPTYVIGVANPPLSDDDGEMAPDTVSNLTDIAEAGGTDSAFLIDTGDPAQTSADFQAAVAAIRGVSISCNLAIPAPPGGRTFERDKVIVSYGNGSTTTELAYDPECTSAAGWHYDDVAAPREVVLCESACQDVEAAAAATLAVSFTCEPVIDIPR